MLPKKHIDIEKAIASKNPALLKWMPGFILRYIKRILHEDDINYTLDKIGDKTGLDFIKIALQELGADVDAKQLGNIPAKGGCIVVANHPLGGLDGIALMHAVGLRRPDVKFLMNDLLLLIEGLKPLGVPVNKHGKSSVAASQAMHKTFASENATLIFPAGMCSRKMEDGNIMDLMWRKGCITNAIKHKRNIIPAFIEGHNSNWFYNVARWRTKLGIKANIEMFYLVNEMFSQKGNTIRITFGKPISYTVFNTSKSIEMWSQALKKHVYALGKNEPLPLPTIDV